MSDSKKLHNNENYYQYRGMYRWIAFVLGSIGQLLNFFNRVNISVLVSYFIERYEVSSASIGLMSSLYFYSCAALQPVIGFLTDRFKPKIILTISFLLITVGNFVYAVSPSFAFIFVGRFLIGIGSAGIFVPASWIITKYFPAEKRGFLFAIFLFFGGVGTLLASYPFAKLLSLFGLKNSLIYISVTFLILTILVFLILKEDSSAEENKSDFTNQDEDKKDNNNLEERKINIFAVFKEIMNIPVIKYGVIVHTILYSTLMLFQGLWAVPFFMDIYKMEKTGASSLVTMIAFGSLAGGLVLGRMLDTKYAKLLYLFSSVSRLAGYLFFLGYMDKFVSYNLLKILLFIWGFCGASMSYIFKVYSVALPKHNYGTAIGILEIFPLIGSALYQTVSGFLFDLFGGKMNLLHRTVKSYQIFFLFLIISMGFAIFFTVKMIKDLNKNYKEVL